MDTSEVYALLERACLELERAEEFAIAAYVGHAMALLEKSPLRSGDATSRPIAEHH